MATEADDNDAPQVIEEHNATKLSPRDWERLEGLLDDPDVEPNEALLQAVKRYKDRV